jgi:hypothetical protein
VESTPTVIKLVVDWPSFVTAAVVLVLFAIAYNSLLERLGDHKEGYTSLTVVGGVAVTGCAFAYVRGIGEALVLAGLFAASGLPMIIGEIDRIIRMRKGGRDGIA